MENFKITKETIIVADRLNKLIKEKGYTQQDLAQKLGISDSLLGSILNKKRNVSAEVAVKLAVMLGITTDELLGLVVDDQAKLDELKKKKRHLEQEAVSLLEQASRISTKERVSVMEKISAIDREIVELDAVIRRSEQFLAAKRNSATIEVPCVTGGATVFKPTPDVKADSAAVGDNGIVLYLKRSNDVQREKLYAILQGSKVTLSDAPDSSDTILGEVTHVLMPTETYKLFKGETNVK